ncbi:nucleoside-diphosphate-sugar epimerase [Tamaricihabitans halophyticus]|uniref:Nucleoside-diphosphate-sugar epimerase n=1 Tax=Tamaricihabitans halophyticus TaxID=1262583 RepID=A0A4R2R6Q9_9PSEU|nr:NAD-dependent epimerase/dehydratase family protein [Tamaricihabitans halophyticus]TCP57548.1 nucleoside-diphosphate-sugar epimerase [Tamaricihabitans halophyticus]
MVRTALILGGTGQVGRAVAARLLADGWRVRVASRGHRSSVAELVGSGVEPVWIDREEPGELVKALGGGVDALIDVVAFEEKHADQLAEVQGDVGAFVVISTASVYRDEEGRSLDEGPTLGYPDFPVPITENQPTVEPGPQTYSTKKVSVERRLLERVERPLTILRPAAIHGPYSTHPREWWFVKRILDGRVRIPLAAGGVSQFHPSAAVNLAALAAAVLDAERPPAILNAADPTAPSVMDIGEIIADYLGWEGELVPLEGDHGVVGLTPWSVPHPLILDTTAAQSLGYRPAADYAGAVAASCDWLAGHDPSRWEQAFPVLAGYGFPLFDYDAEDALW